MQSETNFSASPKSASSASLYTENSFEPGSLPGCHSLLSRPTVEMEDVQPWDSNFLDIEEEFNVFESAPTVARGVEISIHPCENVVLEPPAFVEASPPFSMYKESFAMAGETPETKNRSSSFGSSIFDDVPVNLVEHSPIPPIRQGDILKVPSLDTHSAHSFHSSPPSSPMHSSPVQEHEPSIMEYKQLLEEANRKIQQLKREVQGLRSSRSVAASPSASPPFLSLEAPSASLPFQLQPSSQVSTLWYAERPFPSLTLEVATEDAMASLPSDDLHVKVSVLDANDEPVPDVLSGPASTVDFTYRMSDNSVVINGLRFATVSSKHGGFFRLCVSVCSNSSPAAAAQIAPWVSDKIQVLSYRLYNSPKVPFDQLRPEDDLTRVQGIGALYAKRFASLGIKCVADLAALQFDMHDSGAQQRRNGQFILDQLRRDRGAMTRTKLENYVKQAQEIVRNHQRKEMRGTKRGFEEASMEKVAKYRKIVQV